MDTSFNNTETNIKCLKCRYKIKYGEFCGIYKKFNNLNYRPNIRFKCKGIDILSNEFKCCQSYMNL